MSPSPTSFVLTDSLQDAMSQATFPMIRDTDPFWSEPSMTHRILARHRFYQMRAVPRGPCRFHENMALSHSKAWKERESMMFSISPWSSKDKGAAAGQLLKLPCERLQLWCMWYLDIFYLWDGGIQTGKKTRKCGKEWVWKCLPRDNGRASWNQIK